MFGIDRRCAGDRAQRQIDELWDFADPGGKLVTVFDSALADAADPAAPPRSCRHAIARALGLQGKVRRGVCRSRRCCLRTIPRRECSTLLERGRVLNSSGARLRRAARCSRPRSPARLGPPVSSSWRSMRCTCWPSSRLPEEQAGAQRTGAVRWQAPRPIRGLGSGVRAC